jgi:ABC-2 type transport system ATP-binding protein
VRVQNAVEASSLRKRFGAVDAVSGVELVVPRGSLFGLIGQNGAGKTTFIKMMLGVVRPTAGSIRVLDGTPEDVSIRRRIGYLPERLEFPPGFTPRLLIDSTQRLKGVPVHVRAAECERLLSWVGLEPAAWSRRVGGFSKGMRQRTGLALALVGSPDLLVLDEPTDGIDPLGRADLRDRIASLKQQGTTIFLNSHLLTETEKICDHIAVLHKGAVVRSGALSTLRRSDAWAVRFRPHEQLPTHCAAAGFVDVDAAQGTARLLGHNDDELALALQRALAAGLRVIDVRADTIDLETILREAMQPKTTEVQP